MIELTPNFNLNNIKKVITNAASQIDREIRERLMIVGDEFVALARNEGNYNDQTGNLRSSIGYILFKDGKPISEDFKESDKGTDKITGKRKGYETASSFEDVPKKGYCLVCVAGMDYAAAVESNGKDVISGSTLIAEKLLKESFKRLENKFLK